MIRTIMVEPVMNGFICNVGCQRLVFPSIEAVAENMIAYYRDPEGVEKKYIANQVNKTLNLEPVASEPVEAQRDMVAGAAAVPGGYGR